jgi:hypothetical protein
MRPYVVDRIVSPRGTTVSKTEPERMDRPVGPGQREGHRQHDGERRAGRHRDGGADLGLPDRRQDRHGRDRRRRVRNTTWFIAFAGLPGERPQVAIAVALERQSLTGGATAAPIAAGRHGGTSRAGGEPVSVARRNGPAAGILPIEHLPLET